MKDWEKTLHKSLKELIKNSMDKMTGSAKKPTEKQLQNAVDVLKSYEYFQNNT